MPIVVTVDIICAVFLALLFLGQIIERGRSKKSHYLNLGIVIVFFALIIDAMAYIFMGPETPFAFRYIVCILAYSSGSICFLAFSYYSEAVITEKTKLNPWVFRSLRIADIIWLICTASEFIAGNILVFENELEVADNGFPTYIIIIQIMTGLYTPVVALINRKKIGRGAVLLLSFFNITPIIGIFSAVLTGNDYTYVFAAVTLVLIVEFLQRKQLQLQTKEREEHKALVENYDRIFALEDNFESLYDVDIESGYYDVFVKGEFYSNNVLDKIAKPKDFYEELYKNIDTVVFPEDREIMKALLNRDNILKELILNEHIDHYYRIITEDGPSWLKLRIVYKNEEKKNFIIGVFNAAEEIASREKAEALSMAQAANKAKTDFLFSMSHDIRTPMNAITGFTNMAIKHIDEKEKALDYLEKIQKSGNMLLLLINSVLEVSRIESGNATVDEQYGDVYHSFSNFDQTLHELADSKDIDLSFEFGKITDRYVYADYNRCMRVFVNVISNAIKYTPDGGRVSVKCEQLTDEAPVKEGFGTYKYTVTDNGIGMSEEFREHIFDQFSRESSATVSGVQGSGLGMSVVKSFVELMGGNVSVKSRQGEGTTVTIILPFRIQDGETYIDPVTGEVVSAGFETEKVKSVDFAGKRALLVEDNELNREIALDMLKEEGMLVEEAEDGVDAVEMLGSMGPDHYDFILMDIQMPIMNGYEATKAIRKMYPDAHLPIIALSANAFEEDKVASIEAGMDDHVAKPINVENLFKVLAKFI